MTLVVNLTACGLDNFLEAPGRTFGTILWNLLGTEVNKNDIQRSLFLVCLGQTVICAMCKACGLPPGLLSLQNEAHHPFLGHIMLTKHKSSCHTWQLDPVEKMLGIGLEDDMDSNCPGKISFSGCFQEVKWEYHQPAERHIKKSL